MHLSAVSFRNGWLITILINISYPTLNVKHIKNESHLDQGIIGFIFDYFIISPKSLRWQFIMEFLLASVNPSKLYGILIEILHFCMCFMISANSLISVCTSSWGKLSTRLVDLPVCFHEAGVPQIILKCINQIVYNS